MILKLNQCIDVEKELNYLKKIFYIKNFLNLIFFKIRSYIFNSCYSNKRSTQIKHKLSNN